MFAIPSYGKSFKHAGGRCFINRAVERKAHLHGLMQVSKGNELSNPREAIIAPVHLWARCGMRQQRKCSNSKHQSAAMRLLGDGRCSRACPELPR